MRQVYRLLPFALRRILASARRRPFFAVGYLLGVSSCGVAQVLRKRAKVGQNSSVVFVICSSTYQFSLAYSACCLQARDVRFFIINHTETNVQSLCERLFGIDVYLFDHGACTWNGIAYALKGRDVEAWAPHLSVYMTNSFDRGYLSALADRKRLAYIDDGMSAVSQKTHLYKDGYIPPTQRILSWKYKFLSSERSFSWVLGLTPPLSGYASLPFKALRDQGRSNSFSDLIIASKFLLDKEVEKMIALKDLALSDACYAPHYSSTKNSQRFLHECRILNFEFLEVELLQHVLRLSDGCHVCIYFGVTISVVWLIDALIDALASPCCRVMASFYFVGHSPGVASRDHDSYMDFVSVLSFYKRLISEDGCIRSKLSIDLCTV